MLPPLAVVVLGCTAQVTAQAASWFGIHGPCCPLGHWLGEHACPGCGLTRSTALVLQGEWRTALDLNPAGFVVVALCAGAIALQLDVWRRGQQGLRHLAWRSLGQRAFAAGIAIAWALRLLRHASVT
ncbi:MAG: DUF2752 domain-containing protein [Planctomycetes bacterium]|nr:DUF2752 domain-containing protein [Planctomycetota bacterium]